MTMSVRKPILTVIVAKHDGIVFLSEKFRQLIIHHDMFT